VTCTHSWRALIANLHYGPWSRTMEDGLCQWTWVHGPTSMVRLLIKLVLKALGPSLGVNRMWTKKNDYASKSEDVDLFFNTCPKRAVLNENQVWPFSCLLLGFTCLPFLLNVSKMWLANLLTTTFTKKMSILIYTHSM